MAKNRIYNSKEIVILTNSIKMWSAFQFIILFSTVNQNKKHQKPTVLSVCLAHKYGKYYISDIRANFSDAEELRLRFTNPWTSVKNTAACLHHCHFSLLLLLLQLKFNYLTCYWHGMCLFACVCLPSVCTLHCASSAVCRCTPLCFYCKEK